MGYLIFALFIGVPILEISVFISVGEEIGLSWTLVIVILTAVIGAWMMKRQGLKTFLQLQYQLSQREWPLREVFDGFCLLLASFFLLTPGFITDGMGLLLFMPLFRNLLRASIRRGVTARQHFRGPRTNKTRNVREPFSKDMEGNVEGPVIDVEFKDLTEQDKTETQESEPDPVVRCIDK